MLHRPAASRPRPIALNTRVPNTSESRPAISAAKAVVIGQAINMSRTPFEMRTATPEQGEHTEAVLKEAGYDAAAIASFKQRGVI